MKESSPSVPEEWWRDVFTSEPWAQFHQLKPREQTLKEVEFIKKLAPRDGVLEILDMPCGVGRHAIELAELGHSVTGVDASKNLLGIAELNAAEKSKKPKWELADMRHFKRLKSFDMVLVMWGSLGYFSDKETQQMFNNLHESLKPGGVLVFDQPTLDTFMRGGFSQSHWSETDGLYILEKTHWISETGRNESEWVFVRDGKTTVHKSSIRIYSHHEICKMLQTAGFSNIRSYGSMDLKPFSIGDRLYCAAEAHG